MGKFKLSNPINWLKAKGQFRYKKFVNESENGNNMKYIPLVNETTPVKWQKNKKFKKYTGKGYKKKGKRQKGSKAQKGKGRRKRNKRK